MLLPDEQCGFLPGRSTESAIEFVIQYVKQRNDANDMTYAAFVDFKFAFDSVPRNLLLEALRDSFNIRGNMFNLIKNILSGNEIRIRNGSHYLDQTVRQTVGVAQGDPASPFLFILYVASLGQVLREVKAIHRFYADDLILLAKTKYHLQFYLNELSTWCASHGLAINVSKTKVLRFSSGGRYANADRNIKINNSAIELVNYFPYLGVTLTPKLSFTRHIEIKCSKATAAMLLLGNLTEVDLKTALNVFKIKIAPIVCYCLRAFSSLLSLDNLKEIDKVKSSYLKRVLGLPRNSSSTLALELCEVKSFVEDLMSSNNYVFNESVIQEYEHYREERRIEFVFKNYTDGPGFQSTGWKRALQQNRAYVCRLTWHGYHQYICLKGYCFNIDEDCVCKYCGENEVNRYHILRCDYLDNSSVHNVVKDIFSLNESL